MIKKLIFLSLLVINLVFIPQVFAQYTTTPSQPSRISINKQIFNPQTGAFVDNLSVDQINFLAGQEVTFHITVFNVVQSILNSAVITDSLPNQLIYESSTGGSFDANSNKVTFNIGDLGINESKLVEIKTKVQPSNQLNANLTCPTNLAQVTSGSLVEQDTSSFCIQNQVLAAVTSLPKTGFKESGALFLGSLGLLIISIYILKKSFN